MFWLIIVMTCLSHVRSICLSHLKKHTYPPLCGEIEDETCTKRNRALLQQELSKAKPHFDTVASLMNHTFHARRQWILDIVECGRNL